MSIMALAAAAAFALADGERVVFYGDSITEQKFYTTYVEDYVATRYPGRDVAFFNAGWASDDVSGGFGGPIDVRLARDVVARRPTRVTIMLGMNDGHRLPWSQPTADAYEAGYRHLLDKLAADAPKARLTLLTPSPYDDVTRPVDFEGGYNGVMLRFGAFVRAQAAARGLGLVDFNAPVTALLARARGIDAELSRKLISDRIHPSAGAQWAMAAALLEAWGATPWVSRVGLSAAGGRVAVTEAVDTRVTEARPQAGGLAWTQLDAALPLPIDREDERVRLALRASDVEARLNREPLVVTGLAAGPWRLAIDGAEVGRFTGAELAAGVDLAPLATPMARQAQAVHALTAAHQGVRFGRWRSAEVGAAAWPSPARDRAGLAMDALADELLARRRAVAKPAPHRFVLSPA